MRTVVSVLATVVFAATGVLWWTTNQLGGGSLDTADDGTNTTQNILLMGLDSRRDQDGNDLPPEVLDKLQAGDGSQGGYNTNTLILMQLPPPGGGAPQAFSIPRDALVDIPGEGSDKIKKTYGLAKAREQEQRGGEGLTDPAQLEREGRQAGREDTVQVVEDLTGVPVDHFAEVNLASFYHLADALGGVDVCLNNPVQDDYSGADFAAGPQTIDGEQALSFVRQRHGLPRGDLDRTQRQQAFLVGATAKLQDSGTLLDAGKMTDLFAVAEENVAVDSGLDLFDMAERGQDFAAGEMDFETLPIEGFEQHNGEEVNIVDPDLIRDQVREAFGYDQPKPEQPQGEIDSIDVLNGTDRDGLAASVTEELSANGYPSAETGNAPSPSDRTVVTYPEGEREAAEQVDEALGNEGTELEASPELDSGQIEILLGSDFADPQESDADTNTPAATGPAAVADQNHSAPPDPDAARIPCVD